MATIKFRCTAICMLVLSMPFFNADAATKDYSFIVNDGTRAWINSKENQLWIAEEIHDIKFCNSAIRRCIKSEMFIFVAPNDNSSEWHYEGRSYCEVRRYNLDTGDSKEGDLRMIMSGVGSSCGALQHYDEVFSYSVKFGLRYVSAHINNYRIDMVSSDTYGFASSKKRSVEGAEAVSK